MAKKGKPMGLEKIAAAMSQANWDDMAGDVAAVEGTASLVKHELIDLNAGLGKVKAVERWIRIGEAFRALHEQLKKNKPTDKTRLGWKQAFKDRAKYNLQFDCRSAEKLIDVAAFFDARVMTREAFDRLPVGLDNLYLIAVAFRTNRKLLVELLMAGKITPASTVPNIKQITKEHKLMTTINKPKGAPKPKPVKSADRKKADAVERLAFKTFTARQDRMNFIRNLMDEWQFKADDLGV